MDEHAENAGRGVKWLVRGLILLFFGGLAFPGGRYLWEHRPMDDRTLFETRCTGCHRLPSLERSRDWQWGGVVASMRYLHGAERIITDEEAERIAEYLDSQHEARWNLKERGKIDRIE